VPLGGLGGGPLHRAVLYDEINRAGLITPESDYALEVVADAVYQFAPNLAVKLLPALLDGREVWSQGFSESEAGSDLAALRTRAIRDGDHYIVNGQKMWTSNGQLSDRILTLVRTGSADSRHHGITALLIDSRSPGLTINPLTFANGCEELAECFFSDVRVPSARRIGNENEGWAVTMHLLQFERGMYAWMRQAWLLSRLRQLAASISVVDTAAADSIGHAYQAIMLLRSQSATTIQRLDAGLPVGADASTDKILLAAAEQMVFDAARELLAADFELADTAAPWREQWWYARAATIYGGSAEIQRSILADRVLGLPKEYQPG
jgi:alkylation response protein AidB-like acyl-CoA dehydrogenase